MITVFGCGGDRDKTKRPLMAKEAARYSDICVITSDNPRTEEPQKIIDDILGGMSKDQSCVVESDRKNAIKMAYDMAESGDVVLVAGKGHEDYQIIGTTKHPFSDQDELRKLVK
ncbi:MAG: hypothetical protein ACD_73C00103G0001 [uncultured bacterium]|nr:MAG: hypothetical protein ACD_73C00103G0001 [uncultured bacterium]